MIENLEILSSDGTVKFVDDTTAYIIPRNQSSSPQKVVDEVATWSSVNKFHLHPKKCKEMRLSFSRSIPNDLLVDSIIYETAKSLKLLEITFSKDLRWNIHIN
jgi:hypothetical protein